MHQIYQAVLKGNLVEWQGQVPTLNEPMRIQVTFVEDSMDAPAPQQKLAMLDALDSLAAGGTFTKIDDPVAWQREIRKNFHTP